MRWRSFTVEQARPFYDDREASAALLPIHLLRSSVLTDFATVIAVAFDARLDSASALHAPA